MGTHSVIEHRANYGYIKIEEDYVLLCSQGKVSPHCKALILAIIEEWQDGNMGISLSYPQWMERMYSLFGRTTIIESISELKSEGFIFQEPCHLAGRDTFTYLLNAPKINAGLRNLPSRWAGGNPSLVKIVEDHEAFTEQQWRERTRIAQHNREAEKANRLHTLTLSQWLSTLNHFQWRCAYCEGEYELLEHFVPTHHGGGTTYTNCVPACRKCNGLKNHLNPLGEIPDTKKMRKLLPTLRRVYEYLMSLQGVQEESEWDWDEEDTAL